MDDGRSPDGSGYSAEPEPVSAVSAVPVSIPNAEEDDHCWDYEDNECWNCDGEGYVYGCSWDWQCDTYDEGEGTCLCTRRCTVCHPLTPAEAREAAALQAVLASAMSAGTAETPQSGSGLQPASAVANGETPNNPGYPDTGKE
jgi:hypothetical protein